jgi:hypothetical protein
LHGHAAAGARLHRPREDHQVRGRSISPSLCLSFCLSLSPPPPTLSLLSLSLGRRSSGGNPEREIVGWQGCYHGHADGFLVAAGSGVITLGLPDSPGVPKVPYNPELVGVGCTYTLHPVPCTLYPISCSAPPDSPGVPTVCCRPQRLSLHPHTTQLYAPGSTNAQHHQWATPNGLRFWGGSSVWDDRSDYGMHRHQPPRGHTSGASLRAAEERVGGNSGLGWSFS